MKRLRTAIAAALLGALTACQSGPGKQQTCEGARALYEAYQVSLATGRPISKDEVIAATSAGAFLRLYCGWTNSAVGRLTASDRHGVPILFPPELSR